MPVDYNLTGSSSTQTPVRSKNGGFGQRNGQPPVAYSSPLAYLQTPRNKTSVGGGGSNSPYLKHDLLPQVKRTEVLIELKNLRNKKHCPSGIYIMPSLDTITIWYGVIFVRSGFWKGGVFRFRINIPPEYPEKPPTVYMLTNVFHPLVRPNDGEFNIKNQFPQWRPRQDYLFHVLHYIKNSFKQIVLDSLEISSSVSTTSTSSTGVGTTGCFNRAAQELYLSDRNLFINYAARSAQRSILAENMYAVPSRDCSIVFTNLSQKQYVDARRKIIASNFENAGGGGANGSFGGPGDDVGERIELLDSVLTKTSNLLNNIV